MLRIGLCGGKSLRRRVGFSQGKEMRQWKMGVRERKLRSLGIGPEGRSEKVVMRS